MLLNQINDDRDKTWANSLVIRSKDVAATTTALFIVLICVLPSTINEMPSLDEEAHFQILENIQILDRRYEIKGISDSPSQVPVGSRFPSKLNGILNEFLLLEQIKKLGIFRYDFDQSDEKFINPAVAATLQEIKNLDDRLYSSLVIDSGEDISLAQVITSLNYPRLRSIIRDLNLDIDIEEDVDEVLQLLEDQELHSPRDYLRITNESIARIENTQLSILNHNHVITQRSRTIGLMIALPPGLFILYFGFFTTLRTAIISIINMVGLQNAGTWNA